MWASDATEMRGSFCHMFVTWLVMNLHQLTHIIIFNHYCYAIPLSCSKNTILSLLDTGKYICSIAFTTGVYASGFSKSQLLKGQFKLSQGHALVKAGHKFKVVKFL